MEIFLSTEYCEAFWHVKNDLFKKKSILFFYSPYYEKSENCVRINSEELK